MSFRHDEAGTDERDWQAWLGGRPAAPLELPDGARLIVVAAHPDDESLGAGGLTATVSERGGTVDILVATDGEASHPCSPTTTPDQLAQVRAQEVVAAANELSPTVRVHRLGLPDGQLADHRDAVAHALEGLLRNDSDGVPWLVAAPWRGDHHPDHEAAGQAAAQVAHERGATLLEYPVWAWHWAEPGDERLPWPSLRTLTLSPEVLRRKARALARHGSQTAALSDRPGDEVLLPDSVLAHFRRPTEAFFVTPPGGSASLGRQFFEDFYAAHGLDPWGFESRWYERRKRALTLASLPRERFRRAFEPGCSTGLLTLELAVRCEEVLASDVVASAVEAARERTRYLSGVQVEQRAVPGQWPDGVFDLVVLSEVGYYLAGQDLADLVQRCATALSEDGVLVACHWRHPVPQYPTTGDAVHAALRAHPRLSALVRHEEEDFLLDVLVPAPATSVARASGVIG